MLDLSPSPQHGDTQDKWMWVATYENGEVLVEEDDAGTHGFAEVRQDRLTSLTLMPRVPGLAAYSVLKPEGYDVIFFRRRTIVLDLDRGVQTQMPSLHCLGLRFPDGHAVYTFIGENGTVLITDQLNPLEEDAS